MFRKTNVLKAITALGLFWTAGICPVFGAGTKTLHGHVPAIVSQLQSIGDLPATNELSLAIGVPLRDPMGLSNFLADIYNPASANYRHYLTPEEFTARFGPTEKDYTSVKAFAKANNFVITGTHSNRLVLDVRAKVSDVQNAFHIHLRRFHHPTEAREFFAPDTEPTVDESLPVLDVSGLSNYQLPKPKLIQKSFASGNVVAKATGSGPAGGFIGDDFRAAYVPATALTGAGQTVGMLEFDGFYAKDIAAYASLAGGGRSSIPVQTILLDGYGGTPKSGNSEVALDIEMAMSMAPGLSKIIIFSGGPNGSQNDILNSMAANSTVKNLSCSWGWGGGPSATTENIFQQMSAQGQSFFNASGDSDAFTTGATSANGVDNVSIANAPSSSPNITQVGGTTLTTTGPGGAWQSESVWNWGSGTGSSGGISSYYSIPSWQSSVSMANNQGSTTKRNVPDVALAADNVYVAYGNGQSGTFGGTSCAAPLWAGLTALANQQAVANGNPPAGFVNPTIYAIGKIAAYSQDFHDITKGDNTWSKSASQFNAVSGYDLCTGWGTPTGQSLIDALVGQGGVVADTLEIISDSQLNAVGPVGGPFVPPTSEITLTNSGGASLNWSWLNPNAAAWLTISANSGSLAPHAATNLGINFTAAAANLAVGNYSSTLIFSNQTSAAVQFVIFRLQVLPVLSVQAATGFAASGPVGGPFFPSAQNFTISNLGGTSAVWKVVAPNAWLTASQTTGTVAAASQSQFTISVAARANTLVAGNYKSVVAIKNGKNQIIQNLPFTLRVGENIVSNGGFETGNFSGWTLNASTTSVGARTGLVHSGRYAALLGQFDAMGFLSQTLPTTAGQTFKLSLWVHNQKNSDGAGPNEFQVQWEGATLYDQIDLPFGAWSNLQFTVTATMSGSLLQFGFEDDPYYLGLDDVSVKPIAVPQMVALNQSPAALNFNFKAVPSSIYQVQYKTNLAQADWVNIGEPTASPTDIFTLTDTNTVNCPQKYYRLLPVQ